jgi:single-strand DNA-binding protein
MSLNKVMLIGNVGKDPDVRYLEGNNANGGNTKVASFTLATTERYRDRNGELRENTEWHNITAWRNSADIAEKYIHKGTQVFIEGRLRTRSWNDQSGNKRYTTEVVVDNLQLLGRKSDNQGAQDSGQQGGYRPAQPSYQGGYQQPQAPAQPAYQPQGGYQAPSQPAYQQPAAPQSAPVNPVEVAIQDQPQDDLPF